MYTKPEPQYRALVGSPGQVIVAGGETRIIPSTSGGAVDVYTGDNRRAKLVIRCYDTQFTVLWGYDNTVDINSGFPLGPGEIKEFDITNQLQVWVNNPNMMDDVTIAYYEED